MAEPWVHNSGQPGEGTEEIENEQSPKSSASFVYRPVTHETSDPAYPGDNVLSTEMRNYKKTLGEYTKEMLDALTEFIINGEELWIDAVNSWGHNAVQHLSDSSILRICIAFNTGKGRNRRQALWMCLTKPTFPRAQLPSNPTAIYTNTATIEETVITEITANPVAPVEESQAIIQENDLPNAHQSTSETRGGSSAAGNSYARSSLIKSYSTRPMFGREWTDSITESIELYDTLCSMCGVDEDEDKRMCLPALNYYNNNLKDLKSYTECVQRLFQVYTSDEQRNRLLQEWHTTNLSSRMALAPDKSQVEVFKEACARLSAIQRKLHLDYHRDKFLRDQIVRIADTPDINRSLKERIPGTTHEATQRIAALLSSAAGSAADYILLTSAGDSVSYTRDRRFGGQAKKKFPPRGHRGKRRMTRRVKGCWVCGEDHFARDHHSGRDVRAALERHRKQGREYVAIADVVKLCADAYQSEDGLNFGRTKVNTIIEETLSSRLFQHGNTIRSEQEMNSMEAELNKPEHYEPEFRGIMWDTGANRSSVMSIAQYKDYCREQLSPAALQTPPLIAKEKRKIHGLAGSEVTLGYADIVVPITGLGISPTIRFHILRSNAPTVWCLRDMKRVGGGDIYPKELPNTAWT